VANKLRPRRAVPPATTRENTVAPRPIASLQSPTLPSRDRQGASSPFNPITPSRPVVENKLRHRRTVPPENTVARRHTAFVPTPTAMRTNLPLPSRDRQGASSPLYALIPAEARRAN